jgi:uncharacterized sulfatase
MLIKMLTKYLNFLKVYIITLTSLVLFNLSLLGKEDFTSIEENRPNILWLDVEDLCPDIGCYGNSLVYTPNLDRLALEGVLYTNAFVTGPVCSASRSAIITGMYQTSIGAHNHRSHRRDNYSLPEPVKIVTEYLHNAGYYTCNCEWDDFSKPGKKDYNFNISKSFIGTDWHQRKSDQPFFAQIHFSVTHREFKKDSINPIDPDLIKLPPYYPDHPIARKDWALYLESIQVLDRQIGRILKMLEEEDLVDNTIVFFTADHGRAMLRGKQWLYEGGIHVPLIIRWPGILESGKVVEELISLIDLAPTWLKIAGVKIPEHMQGKCFMGPHIERQYIFAARDRCDETDDRIRSVRTKHYKYIRNFYPQQPYTQFNAYKKRQYPVLTLMEVLHSYGELNSEQEHFMSSARPVEELYNLKEDPYEICNLVKNPEYCNVLEELRVVLDEWICQKKDKGQIPEDPEITKYWDLRQKERYKKLMKERGLEPDINNEKYLEWWRMKFNLPDSIKTE